MRLSMFAVLALSVSSLAAHADTLSASFVTGPFTTTTDSNLSTNIVTFQGFAPTLGSLNSVQVTIGGPFQVVQTGASNAEGANSFFGFYLFDSTGSITLLPQAFSPQKGTGTFSITGTATDTSSAQLAYFTNSALVSAKFEYGDGLFAKDSNTTPIGLTGTITYNYTAATLPVAATPEPSSFALLGTGLLGFVGAVRKRFA